MSTKAQQAEVLAKAVKLIEALIEPHETPHGKVDHEWRKCRRCLAENELVSGGKVTDQLLGAVLAALRASEAVRETKDDDQSRSDQASKSLAERFFDLDRAYAQVDDEVTEALLKAFGHDDWTQFPWPFGGLTYDDYDSSFEIRGIKSNDWAPTREQLDAAFALGFYQCWICYGDNTESHHTKKGSGERRPAHERKQGDWSEGRAKLKKRIADLEAQIAVRESETGWQPIASAPKDGTLILLWESEDSNGYIDGRWLSGHWKKDRQYKAGGCWWDGVYAVIAERWSPLPVPAEPQKETK